MFAPPHLPESRPAPVAPAVRQSSGPGRLDESGSRRYLIPSRGRYFRVRTTPREGVTAAVWSGGAERAGPQVLKARLPLASRGQPPPGGTGLPLDFIGSRCQGPLPTAEVDQPDRPATTHADDTRQHLPGQSLTVTPHAPAPLCVGRVSGTFGHSFCSLVEAVGRRLGRRAPLPTGLPPRDFGVAHRPLTGTGCDWPRVVDGSIAVVDRGSFARISSTTAMAT